MSEDKKELPETPLPKLPEISQTKETNWAEVAKQIFEKSPDPLKEIAKAIEIAIRGRPEAIKAEYELKKVALEVFVGLIAAILVITTWLVSINKLSGETLAFIFGTAFGSIITFLYRFLSGKES